MYIYLHIYFGIYQCLFSWLPCLPLIYTAHTHIYRYVHIYAHWHTGINTYILFHQNTTTFATGRESGSRWLHKHTEMKHYVNLPSRLCLFVNSWSTQSHIYTPLPFTHIYTHAHVYTCTHTHPQFQNYVSLPTYACQLCIQKSPYAPIYTPSAYTQRYTYVSEYTGTRQSIFICTQLTSVYSYIHTRQTIHTRTHKYQGTYVRTQRSTYLLHIRIYEYSETYTHPYTCIHIHIYPKILTERYWYS